MDIYLEFKDIICSNLKIEEFFARLSGSKINVIPYNNKVINVLINNYMKEDIYIICPKKYEYYGKIILSDLVGDFELNVNLVDHKPKDNNYAFVSSSFFRSITHRNAKEVSLVSNMFNVFLIRFFVKKLRDSRSTIFGGFFNIGLSYIKIILPIFAVWSAIFESNPNIISVNKNYALWLSSTGFISFAALLRTLIELNNERNMIKKEYDPLCGQEFIFDSINISVGVFYLCVFALIGIVGFIYNPICGIFSMILSFVYFVFYLSRKTLKFGSFAITAVIAQIILQPRFFLKFIRSVWAFF